MRFHPLSYISANQLALVALFSLGCSAPQAALVAHWAGDGNGLESVSGRTASALNGASYRPGVLGQAFSFDGIDDLYSVPDDPAWAFGGGDFTISLWVTFDSLAVGAAGTLQNPLIAQDEGGGEKAKWSFSYNADGITPVFHINDSVSAGEFVFEAGSYVAVVGEWHHFAVSRAGSNFSFYVDGGPVATGTSSFPVPDANTALTFGWAEGLQFLHGGIDDIRLFDEALTPGEVASLATVPLPASVWLLAAAVGMLGRRRHN